MSGHATHARFDIDIERSQSEALFVIYALSTLRLLCDRIHIAGVLPFGKTYVHCKRRVA